MIAARAASCPTREMFCQYSLGLLSEEQAIDLAGHLDWCPDCQDVMMTLDDANDTVIGRLRTPLSSESVFAEPQLQDALEAALAIPMPMQIDEEGSALSAQHVSDMPEMLGEYRVLAELGRGGMGRVNKALHTKLDRIVAMKVLSQGRVGDRKAIVRFEREMKAVGRLAHPNIVQAHDAREIGGTPVLIMEFVDGLDLAEIVRRSGPLPVADACELIRQTALALQCAHDHGLVHRDIKPSNVMLARSGEVKLLDLGLARFFAEDRTDGSAEEMTGTGQAMGTADYMAPEQASESRAVDIRADIYSLGCTLYKLLAGRAPFSGPEYRTTLDKMNAHANQPAPAINQFVPEAAGEVVAILDRMLAKNPGDRFATPADVVEALVPWCAGADLRALLARAEASIIPTLPPLACERMGEGRGEGSFSPASQARPAARPPLLLTSWGWKWFVGQLILLIMAGGLGFALGIIITIKRNGQTYQFEPPEGSRTVVDQNGNATINMPDKPQDGAQLVVNSVANSGNQAQPPNAAVAAGLPAQAKTVAEPQKGQGPPVPAAPVVTVSQPITREVADYLDLPGFIVAAQTAEIRARVTGNLEKVRVKPGMSVKQGDILMEIDSGQYRAELDQALVAVKQAKVRLDLRNGEFKRAEALLRNMAVGQSDFDQAKAQHADAEAGLQTAEAAVNVARLRLEHTKIVAPFAGTISGPVLDAGNLATADNTVLATISSTDPMHVEFYVEEPILAALRRKGSDAHDAALSLPVLCALSGDKDFLYHAKMDSVDSTIVPGNRVRCCALLPNKEGNFMRGMNIRVRLITSEPHKVLLVSEWAFGAVQGQRYVYVVNDQNVLERRMVKVGQRNGDLRVVTEGLKAEDWVVTSSLRGARPGMTIKPEKTPPPAANTPPATRDAPPASPVGKSSLAEPKTHGERLSISGAS